MKRSLTAILMLFSIALGICAENYVVYSVLGAVKQIKGSKKEIVAPKDSVKTESVLVLPQGGKIVLLNAKESTLYTLKMPGVHSVGELIAGGTKKKMGTESCLNFLKQLFNDRYYVNDDHAIVDRQVELGGIQSEEKPDSVSSK